MSLTNWILFYIAELLFWLWVIRWGGAKWLEGTFTSGLLISVLAPNWSADGIKLFAWLTLIVGTIWFIIGLIVPQARIF